MNANLFHPGATMQRSKCLLMVRTLLLGAMALAAAVPNARGGDYAMDWSLPRPWPFNREDPPGKPTRVTALWSETVLTQTGKPAMRRLWRPIDVL